MHDPRKALWRAHPRQPPLSSFSVTSVLSFRPLPSPKSSSSGHESHLVALLVRPASSPRDRLRLSFPIYTWKTLQPLGIHQPYLPPLRRPLHLVVLPFVSPLSKPPRCRIWFLSHLLSKRETGQHNSSPLQPRSYCLFDPRFPRVRLAPFRILYAPLYLLLLPLPELPSLHRSIPSGGGRPRLTNQPYTSVDPIASSGSGRTGLAEARESSTRRSGDSRGLCTREKDPGANQIISQHSKRYQHTPVLTPTCSACPSPIPAEVQRPPFLL